MQQCLLTAADVTKRENRIMFIGDSRVRELFHEFVDTIIGTPRTYVRTHSSQLVTVDRLRLRAVSTASSIISSSLCGNSVYNVLSLRLAILFGDTYYTVNLLVAST